MKPVKVYDHDQWMEAHGACPACDGNKGRCDRPVRISAGLFGTPSVGEAKELFWLDNLNGLPDWFPYERRREGME